MFCQYPRGFMVKSSHMVSFHFILGILNTKTTCIMFCIVSRICNNCCGNQLDIYYSDKFGINKPDEHLANE